MKKIIVLSLISLTFTIFCFHTPIDARADAASYARITKSGVYLYSSPSDADGLFSLPESYFVKITGELDEYYYVSYLYDGAPFKEIKGYCKKAEVETVSYVPETPYLEYKIQVTYTVDESLPDNPLSTYVTDAVYYGEFAFGTNVFYYVSLGGEFGYIPASNSSEVKYPLNTEHTQNASDTKSASTDGSSVQSNAVRIVLICALSVFAVGAVYFLFKPQRAKPPQNPFYDENENY